MSVLDALHAPRGWRSIPFGRAATRTKESGRPDLPPLSVFLGAGVVPRDSREDNHNQLGEDLGKYLVVRPGDLVFNKLRTWQGGLGASEHEGIVSPAYFVCRPTPDFDSRFLQYLLLSDAYLQELTRVSKWQPPSQFDIGWEQLRAVPIVSPGVPAQRAIADYLDTETARLDALIEKKKGLSELLETRRVAALWEILSRACPNPNRIKWLVTKVGSGSTPRGGSEVYVDDGVAFLRSQNVRDGRVILDDVVYITEKDDANMSGTRVVAGDVLINITGGSIGRTAVVLNSDLPANVSQHVCILRPISRVAPQVLQAALDTQFVKDQISLAQVGGNREGLNFEQIKRLEVHVPLEESHKLVQVIDDVNRKHREAVTRIRLQANLLREHRQALITAAVTGELDITEVTA